MEYINNNNIIKNYFICFFLTAYSYPIATLSRTMNPYTKEVLDYVSFYSWYVKMFLYDIMYLLYMYKMHCIFFTFNIFIILSSKLLLQTLDVQV